jgi:hypothetical protein
MASFCGVYPVFQRTHVGNESLDDADRKEPAFACGRRLIIEKECVTIESSEGSLTHNSLPQIPALLWPSAQG